MIIWSTWTQICGSCLCEKHVSVLIVRMLRLHSYPYNVHQFQPISIDYRCKDENKNLAS
jgi:hypothetical protein